MLKKLPCNINTSSVHFSAVLLSARFVYMRLGAPSCAGRISIMTLRCLKNFYIGSEILFGHSLYSSLYNKHYTGNSEWVSEWVNDFAHSHCLSSLLSLLWFAGVGTRNYYRKMGYELEGPYMVKDLFGSGMDWTWTKFLSEQWIQTIFFSKHYSWDSFRGDHFWLFSSVSAFYLVHSGRCGCISSALCR